MTRIAAVMAVASPAGGDGVTVPAPSPDLLPGSVALSNLVAGIEYLALLVLVGAMAWFGAQWAIAHARSRRSPAGEYEPGRQTSVAALGIQAPQQLGQLHQGRRFGLPVLQHVGDVISQAPTGPADDRLDQPIATAEVVVDRGVGHADVAGYGLHPDRGGSVHDQPVLGGVEDLLASALGRPGELSRPW